jgi:LppX/LprAFG-like lipoprotein
MHRRAPALLAVLLLATVAVGACGSSTPAISDPKEIITKAVAALQDAKSAHVDATVEGTLSSSLLGGAVPGDITLGGTTLAADVDLAAKNLHLTMAVPAMLGMTADVIVIGADTYTKISLSGDKYVKSTTSAGTPTDPATAITELKTFLDRPEIAPAKKDDASCGSKSCYVVQIALTADELKTLVPATDLGDATVTLSITVEKDTLRPASINVSGKGAKLGDLTLKVTFSNWDKPVTVTAPPADQVQ